MENKTIRSKPMAIFFISYFTFHGSFGYPKPGSFPSKNRKILNVNLQNKAQQYEK